jgi:hypothetical protein
MIPTSTNESQRGCLGQKRFNLNKVACAITPQFTSGSHYNLINDGTTLLADLPTCLAKYIRLGAWTITFAQKMKEKSRRRHTSLLGGK